MALETYKGKRDPKATPEPFGGKRRRGKEPIFVVQRHDARRLHYDFRLERNGALASWAVPKGVPLEPGQRALAVHVEDHPLDYATFEGEIPKGQYGAGTVEIWDHGTYELVEEKRDGGLTVRLRGERLDGTWTLIPAKLDGDPKNWLLIRKREDAPARERREYAPMLATPEESVPHGGGWVHEIKWDGYRIVAYLRAGEGATLKTRRGQNYTERFKNVASALPRALRTPDCVLDGEVCALDDRGRPSFSAMQQAKPGTPIVYFVFDLLELEGEPLVDLPLHERRARLERLLDKRNKTVRHSETFDDGEALLEAAREQELEGILSKRSESPYRVGRRTREWLKIKTHGRQEFVICGYTKGQGRRERSFGSLVLGVYRDGQLEYVGNVGTGFNEPTIRELLDKLKPLERKTAPFPELPKMPRVRKGDVVWVEPNFVCEVEFVEWTHDGRLRAPSFQGLRDDKTSEDVERETPAPKKAKLGSGRKLLELSNLDKLFWPEEGITKGDLIEYYRAVAPVLVPHLRDRPFTMKRYPDGWQGGHFFQKDAPTHMPDWIPTFRAPVSTRDRPPRKKLVNFPLVNEELALLWMANMGCIDMNPWYSRVDKPDRPDFVLFDLDPSPDVGFREAVQVALIVRDALDALGLVSFAKTSGSEGMHVLVPVERRHTYDDTRHFSEIVANAIARSHRGLATTEWSKAKRRGVLIDSNQNGEGKTIASVYSVRPKAGAPVSTPLRWDEVNERLDPQVFTMDVVLERVRKHGDLFEGVLTTRQRLDKALASLG
jgi:bifunctional non-homologous end joining protein LigD